ncbi:hypothetical protein EJB14_10085 [Bacillus pumilus]|uniref:zinc-finger-containing protein n=1 Tax=Bacillus pumilus TaxID=1408 RepID=UPI000F89C726|nr:zinc-finger-containing protein [Bacillus pumilus]RST66847.1 hypothetical protein EJB14_10085 [Bacillus pumilus]
MNCPYCHRQAQFLTSLAYYGRDYGTNVYVCIPCGASVGTHRRSKTPLGTMANAELKGLRMKAHELFDPLWKNKVMSRKAAYAFLRKVMGLSKEQAHIGKFNKKQCLELIGILRDMESLKEEAR